MTQSGSAPSAVLSDPTSARGASASVCVTTYTALSGAIGRPGRTIAPVYQPEGGATGVSGSNMAVAGLPILCPRMEGV